ncbi:MAG TPA: glycine cleavage T C-terminal barrel domain-containing protein [Pyrinomonadaceae bacterium]|nr:glycine cleavage T C-terminal barrel domain-containing protein [Pyrinomonadaceae bacterium]
MTEFNTGYEQIRSGGSGFYQQGRGLIAVHGGEAVQFLDGLISNDVKTLEDGGRMTAAFPNAQGRLLALVRVVRQGERFLFETEGVTRQKIFDNLFRFTFAGDFFVEDLSETYRFISVFDRSFIPITPPFTEFDTKYGADYFVHREDTTDFLGELKYFGAEEISDELFETLRIEYGMPRYGIDMDENTIVPEIGIEDTISYTKGCYIGQEIIARIHFRGHVAKKLTGIKSVASMGAGDLEPGQELLSKEGKNAGRITSVTISPKLQRAIGLAYVRYEHLSDGTELLAGDTGIQVTSTPFI